MQKEERFRVSGQFNERQIRSGISVPIRVPGQPETTYGVLEPTRSDCAPSAWMMFISWKG